MNDVHIACADGSGIWVSPTGGGTPGNIGPQRPKLYQTAAYWGREAFTSYDKCYWNVALGLAELGPSCVLEAGATATSAPADADGVVQGGAAYPYVRWTVPLTDASGALSCGAHALDVPGSGVATAYLVAGPTTFESSLACETPPAVSSAPRMMCAGTLGALGTTLPISTRETANGVSVRVGDKRSTAYLLPAGFGVDGCCLNPCCAD